MGSNHGTIPVSVQPDSTPELNETFAVRLTHATGAILDPLAQGAVTVIYDDDLKELSFNVFYDNNGNGFNDLKDFGISALASALTVTYMNGTTPVVATLTGGELLAVSVHAGSGGAGYAVNDVLTIFGGTGTPATVRVSSVSGGAVTGVQVLSAGNYSANPALSRNPATGGSGRGLGQLCH